MPNRLAHEASAYLKQHANNPVDWFPWGPEALEKAKREDKPIFLSIGYSACHWCHVMEHESFSNDAIAATLNTQFVPIKVDREERPDLDQVYQTVVQLLGRSGGWPLSVFLTPDQAPFFGGTYFPPAPKYGMPSFGEVLKAVRDAYDTKRDDVKLQADDLTRAITKIGEGTGGAAPIALDRTLLAQAAKKLVSRFDDEHGGFGARPKFPNTMNVEVLLRRAVLDRDTDCEARVKRALDGMADGGIHDQLAGGFHRYSTDEKWLVPHFEKMLYDNALLLRLYVDAGRALDRGAYLDVARKIADYLLREMQSPTGAFYATQDADSEGEEGRHFVWTPDDVDAAVSSELGRTIVKTHFGIKPGGNFERTGATVLSIAEPLDRIVVKLGLPPSEVDAALAIAMGEMLAARERREKPFRDEKMLASWNGLAIGALAEAGLALGEPRYIDAAKRALTDVLARLEREGRVDRYFTADGHVARPGFLDDHANLANAALDVAEATGDTSWVAVARRIADVIVARFDDGDGGFTFAPRDGEKLLATMRDPWDQATPSGGSMTALLLLRLGVLVGGAYATTAEKMLEKMSGRALENPFGCGQMLCVIDRLVRGSVDVVIVGETGPARDALHAAAGARWIPNRNLVVTTPADAHIAGALAADKPGPKDGGALAYVCRDRACGAPVSTADALARTLG